MTEFECFALYNENPRDAMFEGYRGEALAASVVGRMEFTADTPEAAASMVFRHLNMDTRPNCFTERSLSVGDVIEVRWVDPMERWPHRHVFLAVEGMGFKEVANPRIKPRAKA